LVRKGVERKAGKERGKRAREANLLIDLEPQQSPRKALGEETRPKG